MRDWILFGDGAILLDLYRRNKWIDQILHALLFGGLAYLHPSIAIVVLMVRELAPKPLGQWGPGDVLKAFPKNWDHEYSYCASDLVPAHPKDRVEDLRIDLAVSLSSIAIVGLF